MATPYATCPDDQRLALKRALVNAVADWSESAIDDWSDKKVSAHYGALKQGTAYLNLNLPLEDPGFSVVHSEYGCREAHSHHD